jgi:moderate conductance mechanosensitive channel
MDGTAFSGLLVTVFGVDPALAAVLGRLLSFLLTVAALVLAYRLVRRLIDRLPGDTARVRTLMTLLVNLARWVLAFVLLVILLRELGVDVGALLVSAGVVGVAIGLGAQSLIRDLIAGLFVLFEGLIAVGDVIEVGGHRGTVESIGLRVTRLRQDDGSIRVVPNGALSDFVNLSSDWARAIVDIGVPREVDVSRALEALRRVGEEWAAATGAALATPEAQGIMRLTGGEMVLRLLVKVDPARRFEAEIELRRRIKDAFDREPWSTAVSRGSGAA